MRPLKNAWNKMGKIFATIGGVFLALAIIGAALSFGSRGESPVFFILTINFGAVGAPFFIMGMCFYLIAKRGSVRRERLKADGLAYDAEIVRVLPYNYLRITGYIAGHLECSYRNDEGKTCLVKSECLLFDYSTFHCLCNEGKGTIGAKVYVSHDDPRVYSVDVSAVAGMDAHFDYDYR
jgi:hypothetical protein